MSCNDSDVDDEVDFPLDQTNRNYGDELLVTVRHDTRNYVQMKTQQPRPRFREVA
jgi:hypothetical protein